MIEKISYKIPRITHLTPMESCLFCGAEFQSTLPCIFNEDENRIHVWTSTLIKNRFDLQGVQYIENLYVVHRPDFWWFSHNYYDWLDTVPSGDGFFHSWGHFRYWQDQLEYLDHAHGAGVKIFMSDEVKAFYATCVNGRDEITALINQK